MKKINNKFYVSTLRKGSKNLKYVFREIQMLIVVCRGTDYHRYSYELRLGSSELQLLLSRSSFCKEPNKQLTVLKL